MKMNGWPLEPFDGKAEPFVSGGPGAGPGNPH
jgi:hypothetical protein